MQYRNNSTRWFIAIAASLSLHLAVAALLPVMAPSNGISFGRLAGLNDAPLTVSISITKNQTQPAIRPSSQLALMPASRITGARMASRNSGQSGREDSRYLSLPGRYFTPPELDVIPRAQHDVDLSSLESLDFKHDAGQVVLRLWIDEAGRVRRVETVSSDMPAIFSEVAESIFMRAQFVPGLKSGLAVKSKVEAVLYYPPRDLPPLTS